MKPAAPPALSATRLLDQVRERIRYKHYSLLAAGLFDADECAILVMAALQRPSGGCSGLIAVLPLDRFSRGGFGRTAAAETVLIKRRQPA